MSVSRSQILDLLQRQAMPQGVMFGGKRGPGRPRKVGRPRRTRGSGEMEEMMATSNMDQLYGSARRRPRRYGGSLLGGSLIGGSLIGGKKKPKKRMSQATKDLLASYRTGPRTRKSRGGAGLPDLNDVYDELVDEALYNGDTLEDAQKKALAYIKVNEPLLKYGVDVKSKNTKENIIKAIKKLEKNLGMPASITTELHKFPKARLEKILNALRDKSTFGHISAKERDDAYDEDINPYKYGRLVGFVPPAEEGL